jgi:hypothetical protein
MTTITSFPPLQGAIAQAEAWTQFLKAQREEIDNRPSDIKVAYFENMVWYGVQLGEAIPLTWRLTFDSLFRIGDKPWSTVTEFEAVRQEVRRLFFTAREAMDVSRVFAHGLQLLIGRKPEGLDRLLIAIECARQLEEAVFRDWPSFVEPLASSADALPVDASLADVLGMSLEEAQQKMEARRRELNSKKE